MTKTLHSKLLNLGMLLIAMFFTFTTIKAQTEDPAEFQSFPELTFKSPVLVSGVAGKEGAIYRFSNIAPGIDGLIKLRKFSHPNIQMATIDNSSFGWNNAFQPEFGMNPVPANTKWFIDFTLSFVHAGTSAKKKIDRFVATSLNVDGDGMNVSEFVIMHKASSVTYSTVSYLQNVVVAATSTCGDCGKISSPKACTECGGNGLDAKQLIKGKYKMCANCDGVGKVYILCGHPFDGEDVTVNGPTENFLNIDTAATQVMASYVYNNKDSIDFTIGAQSGARNNYGAGIRLNSLWFKSFSMAPIMALPVKLQTFSAVANKADVTLNWTTTQEENFSHFIVERSTDGKNYAAIATVLSASEAGSLTNYRYKDATVTAGTPTYFYRLKFVDKTGEASLSQILSVRFNKTEGNSIALATYPNPVTDVVKITLPIAFQGKAVTIELYNATGIRVSNLKTGNASQTETMQMSHLTKGFYIIKAICENATAQERVIKN